MKTTKIIYWIVTGLFCLWMALQGVMFLAQPDAFADMFTTLGYPASLVVPLGIAKLAGIIAILAPVNPLIKRLAYFGFFIDFLAAIGGHFSAGDGRWPFALVALIIGIVSFVLWRKILKAATE